MSANAALALVDEAPAGRLVSVASDVLGPLQVPEEAVFLLPEGMFGFPECRRFALVAAGRAGLYWLQSLEHTALTFLMADPFPFVPGYAVELGAADRAELGVRHADDVAVLCVVTLPHAHDALPTANLQGPLALDVRGGRGRQLALGETRWGVRHPLRL